MIGYSVMGCIIFVFLSYFLDKDRQKNMCVCGHMSKKSRVGRSVLLFFLLSANSRSRFRYFIFEISGKPSFVEAVL